VIRADRPGLEKDDVKVNVAQDAVTIHGERHRGREEERKECTERSATTAPSTAESCSPRAR
jgi:HSP20 family molecular chaperone IbpA